MPIVRGEDMSDLVYQGVFGTTFNHPNQASLVIGLAVSGAFNLIYKGHGDGSVRIGALDLAGSLSRSLYKFTYPIFGGRL